MLAKFWMPKSFWWEFTPWSGWYSKEKTLLGPIFHLGWMSIGFSQERITAWIKTWHDTLKAATKGDDKK